MSTSTNINTWDEEDYKHDRGVWLYSKVISTRFHTITTKSKLLRYNIAVVDVEYSFLRQWNQYNNEQIPNIAKPEKEHNPLSFEDLMRSLSGGGAPIPDGIHSNSLMRQLHPYVHARVEVWVNPEEPNLKSLVLNTGDEVVIKTAGGFFVKEVINKRTGTFKGEGGSIMNNVGNLMDRHSESSELEQDKKEGARDDEWSDD